MAEILIDSFTDTIKVVPVIFIIFILVDLFMRKVNSSSSFMDKISKYDYLGGSLLGIVPQCGIPVAMANLYSNGYITLGMLIAVFLSSSDEALIIIGTDISKLPFIVKIIACKVMIAIPSGYVINKIIKEKRNRIKACSADCSCPKCKKYNNIWLDNLVSTAKITVFLLVTVVLINLGLEKLGQEHFYTLLGKNSFLQPIFAAFIGMIPSCASSVLLAEGFIKGGLSFGALIAGLCANTGYGVLVILKELPLKRSLKVIAITQFISILTGEIMFLIWR